MSTAETIKGTKLETKRRPLVVDTFIRLIREKPLGTAGGIILIIWIVIAVFANFITPYDLDYMSLRDRLAPPSAQYLLGTDNLGRDLLSRIIFGARTSIIVGVAGTAIATLVALLIGVISGYSGKKVDIIIQRFVDGIMCFPPLLLLITIISMIGTGLIKITLVLGVVYGIAGSRVIRSAVIGIKSNIYVDAGKSIGASSSRIMLQHIIPNIMAPTIVLFTVRMGTVILAEASLSFLGYGVPPPLPSWGGMLSGAGIQYMLQAPFMAFWPGLALSSVVYGINVLGDAVRDVLDPKLKGGASRYSGVKVKEPKDGGNRQNDYNRVQNHIKEGK